MMERPIETENRLPMARMTLNQLEIFLATAEHLHFTKAAEALSVAPTDHYQCRHCLPEKMNTG
ncbi:MAG UNVERIFIED_CONTAM: LysR family transcriptional regulator [Microcystis novacekii LVE1205-3]|jgi:hypothetical protein